MSLSSTVLAAAVGMISLAKADHFDDHDLKAIQGAETRGAAVKGLSLTELAGLPKVVQGAPQSVLLVVRTDEGNWSKLLVRGDGIKRKGAPQPKPFLHVERMETYSADARRGIVADKRDVYLFGGFFLDLDIGQIVAKGDGGDLEFQTMATIDKATPTKESMMERDGAKFGPLLGDAKVVGDAKLFVPRQSLVAASKPSIRAKGGGAIGIADFVGKYRLDVDGRFTGTLDLKIEDGKLVGGFRSEQTGAVYQATGEIGTPPQQMTLSIAFPRTDLKLDGRLFTRSRTKIAGSAVMEENAFGFVAERID